MIKKRIADPEIMRFIQKVDAYVDPEIDALGAAFRHAARVRVELTDGRSVFHEILNRRGSPENPLSHDDVVYKFKNIVGGLITLSTIDDYLRLTDSLDQTATLEPLLDLLSRALKQ